MTPTRKLLIVDDVKTNRLILREILQNDYDILEAAGGEEALSVLSREHSAVSAVLLDISMPGIDGYEVLRRIRENTKSAQLPVIMITGSEGERSRVLSLAQGANDYVTKPYNAEVIRHCLKNQIALHEAAETVSALQRDRLTGLYSRETFFDRVQEMISAKESGYYVMSCFDIDKFKVINDQYGTKKGDEVLRHTAKVFREGFHPVGGICCRISSDNFAVLYPASFMDSQELVQIRERASRVEGLATPVVFCIGRYIVNDFSLSPNAMYDRAVLAAASIKGRYDERIAIYNDSMREHIMREQAIVNDMEAALRSRQFEVWFQPQYNHSTDAMIGAEALVRWRHPEKGIIPPNDFIPIFEKNGFIYSLDSFVWEETCRYLRKWRDEGRNPLPVSVNVSRPDVLRPDIVDSIVGLVEKYELPRELLRLEVTESAFTNESDRIVSVVKELVGLGFTVEIDDFGSGYSSLNTLKDVPAQIIKLDMKFLASSDDSQRGGNIVESVVRMAKWLGMSVIAEGVETLEQANFLRSIGCNYMQGYLYARPMPAEKYEQHCAGSVKEERLLTLETVENLDNNAFWDPESLDTLIFNSYVGGACIYEYHNGSIELIRATEKYAQVIGSAGMTVEDALKLNWAEHLDEENAARIVADLDSSIATGKEITGEYVFLDLPGCPHETYLRSTMRVIASAGDRYLVYCTNENMTAQRRAERQERRASEQMQAIMDNVDLGIIAAVVKDGTAKYLFANNRYYDMLGYTKEQFEREIHSPYQTIAPADRQWMMEETARINTSGKSVTVVYTAIKRDGSERAFRSSISMGRLTGADGPVQFTILRDITDEVAAERRERLAMEQIKGMMDDMPGGFARMHVEADGSIRPVYINEGLAKLTGMKHDDMMKIYENDAFVGVHPDDIGIVEEAVAKMLERGEARSARYRLIHGSESYVWLSIFGRVTKGVAGDTFLNVYYTDATEQMREEEAQKALLDNLPGGAGIYEFKDGRLSLTYQNKSYWELVGLKEELYPDSAPMSAVHPDDAQVIMHELSAAVEQRRDVACDIRLKHLTDGYILVHLVGRIVYKETGGFLIYTTFTPINTGSVTYQQMLPLLLSAMMDSTSDLSFAKDANFRYMTASRAFANMVGVEEVDDLVGKTDYDLFAKDLADKFRRDDIRLLKSGKSLVDMTESIPSADGSPRYSNTSKYILRDGSGEIIGLYGVGRDITKAVVQEGQLKLVTDSVPGGLATYAFYKNTLRVAYCNDGFCALFGGTRKGYEARGDFDPIEWVFEEDRAELMRQILALVNENAALDCVFRVHVLGGGYKWINERASTTERHGETVLFNSILLDITDRQNALERLRISEEENALATRLGGSVIMRYIVADKTLVLAPEAASASGLAERETNVPEGPISHGMISPETAEAYAGFFAAIADGNRAGMVLFQQRYEGEWRWMEAKSTTIFSDDGKPVKAVISMLDVTERLEKETIYKKWQQSLTERTAESYTLFRCNLNRNTPYDTREGTLISAMPINAHVTFNQRAEAYAEHCVFEEDRAYYLAFTNSDTMLADYYRGKRSDFIEYREVLPNDKTRWLRLTVDLVEYPNSTDVEAYLMYEDIDAAKRAELQTKALSETDPLTGVLNRATFSKMVNHILASCAPGTRHALLMLDIDSFKQVNDVFGHSAGDQALIGIANGLRAIVRGGDLVGRLGGDEFMVFLNGIHNDSAVEAKAKQICALTKKSFSLEVQISGSIGVVFAPDDGMDFDTLYKKVDSALYYVKGSGKDNVVIYDDMMADEHLEPEADPPSDSGAELAEKKRRMLIVDDNKIDHAMLQNIFQDEFIIEKARDGNSALIRLRHYGNAISVVLLDLVMPGMDGFAVLKKMQESPELRSIPVIIVSGDESRETCLRAIRRGATDFVTKPVDADILRVRVHSAVSRAENERLREKNGMLEAQSEERGRYDAVMERSGITFIELNWLSGDFTYHPSISTYLSGVYDDRGLWRILLSDMVGDTKTVQDMQQYIHAIAEDRERADGSMTVKLRTPQRALHSFRMNVRKLTNEYQLTNRIVISLLDMDYEAR